MTETLAEQLFMIGREHGGRLVRVDFNRPGEGNAMTEEMCVALTALINSLGADPNVRVISLEGRGPDFCKGRDVKGENRVGMSAFEVRERVMSVILDTYRTIDECAIPVVARVHGLAAGFGAALSACCDLTIASEDARFSFPEIERQIPPALAMSTLVNAVSPKAVSFLIYSGRQISAGEALMFGLVSKVFDTNRFAAEYDKLLLEMIDRPRVVLQTIKRYERRVRGLPSDMAREYAGTLLALAQTEIKKPTAS